MKAATEGIGRTAGGLWCRRAGKRTTAGCGGGDGGGGGGGGGDGDGDADDE